MSAPDDVRQADQAASEWDRLSPLPLATVIVEYGLLALIIWKYELINATFLGLIGIIGVGMVVTHLLPNRWRMSFFAALSVGGMAILLGAAPAFWLVLLGLSLIGIAHLPVAFIVRVVILLVVTAGLAVLRYDPERVPAVRLIWPILGSMFMFRMIIYMYDLKHRAAPFSPSRAVAYFFMLPNVLFPLFPVVDYKTFCRSHLAGHPAAILQKGIEWILRGVVHLIAYRLMYQNFMLDPLEVRTGGQAAQFIATAFLRYLQVSGNYHLVIGMLCLFGFNLPDVFNRWLLSSSFANFWRRVNIYWKDFMQKVFFTPVLFALKGLTGETVALVAATALVMFVTWALHAYQTFWIGGIIQNGLQDTIFWTFLGVMILINLTWEARFGRKRRLAGTKHSLAGDLWLALRTVAFFVVICIAWTLWSSNSVSDWLLVVRKLPTMQINDIGWIVLALAALGVIAIVSNRFPRKPPVPTRPGAPFDQRWFWRSAVMRVGCCGVILMVAKWPTLLMYVSPHAGDMVRRVRVNRLNARDARELERGYYEDLLDVSRFNPELAELYAKRPVHWNVNPVVRELGPGVYPMYDYLPDRSEMYKGALFETNRWGFRDRDYDPVRPEGVYRIAMMGSSHVVGVGVSNDKVFENLIEERLNREGVGEGIDRVEILNFSVSGYGPLSCLATLEKRILDFNPDLFLYSGMADLQMMLTEIGHANRKKAKLPYEYVREALETAGVESGQPQLATEQVMRPAGPRLLAWIYQRMVEQCLERDIDVAALLIPRPDDSENEQTMMRRQGEIAAAAGFEVLNSGDVFGSVTDLSTLWVAPWDRHPSALGHRLLAEAAYAVLAPHVRELIVERRAPTGE